MRLFRVRNNHFWAPEFFAPEQYFAFAESRFWPPSRFSNSFSFQIDPPLDRHYLEPPAPNLYPFRPVLAWNHTSEPISKTKTDCINCTSIVCKHTTIFQLTLSSSSNTFLSFFIFLIPFSWANFSHFVNGLGTGHFLDLGKTNVGGGSLATTHSSTRSVGNSHSSLTISWTFSLVRSNIYCSLCVLLGCV